MRKTLILTCALFLLSVCIIAGLHFTIDGQKNQVEMTETTIAGNRSAAEGINVKLNARDNTADINWDLSYEVGRKTTEHKAEFRYSNAYLKGKPDFPKANLELNLNILYNAMEKAVEEEKKDIDIKRSRTFLIPLRDLTDFLPLSLTFYGGGVHEEVNPQDYFKVPCPDISPAYAVAEKDSRGEITTEYYYSGSYELDASGLFRDKDCYIAVTGLRNTASGIYYPFPENLRGIHHIPVESGEKSSQKFQVDWEGASLVYPLEKDVKVEAIAESENQNYLFLFTEETGRLMLSVITTSDMKLQKKLLLKEKFSHGDDSFSYRIGKDYLSLLLEDGTLFLLTEQDGKYEVFLKDSMLINNELYLILVHCILEEDFSVDFDGKRLAIVISDHASDIDPHLNHYLMVFEKSGLSYAGKYDFSLDDEEVYLWNPYEIEIHR